VEVAKKFPATCFIRVLIPIMTALPSSLNHIPKAPSLNTITSEGRISTYVFGEGTNIQTVAVRPTLIKFREHYVPLESFY
jgi:hypothetical protein